MSVERKECYNLTELKERGWTASIIRKLVIIPPIEFKGLYRKQPQKCYPKKYIKSIEQTDLFLEIQKKTSKRQLRMKVSADRQRNENIAKFTEEVDSVKVPLLSKVELKKRTIKSKKAWYDYQASLGYYFDNQNDVNTLPKDVLHRWEVNFIRHELTRYEQILSNIRKKVGVRDIYTIIKNRILDKIAIVYPWLTDECKKQRTHI